MSFWIYETAVDPPLWGSVGPGFEANENFMDRKKGQGNEMGRLQVKVVMGTG